MYDINSQMTMLELILESYHKAVTKGQAEV